MSGKNIKSLGFTLVELMVTVAIVGIIAAFGMPSFQEMLYQNRATSLANELVASLNLARSEAIKRGNAVTICKSDNTDTDAPSCSTSATWSSGWLIFVDMDSDGTVDAADTPLRVGRTSDSSIQEVGTDKDYISYLPSGLSKWDGGLANGSLEICSGDVKRTIIIGPTGRIRITKGTCS